MPIFSFGLAFAVSAALIPLIRQFSLRRGATSQPRTDRWHKVPTPIFGGIGIFIAFLLSTMFSSPAGNVHWSLLAALTLMFGLGLYDDLKQLTPPVKLVGQLIAALIVVLSGYRTDFFSEVLLNLLVTVLWLVGITNAINLLDNMDGLAGGISLIAAGFLSFVFWYTGGEQNASLLIMALALAGGIAGFLVYNFPPASIFMGDSGSLSIGFTLAVLAIARPPQASNIFAVMGVPTLVFLLPILDTTFVTFTRLLRGQSPAQGGRDHTSHRLVAFGLSERQAVLVLYAVALVSGVVGTGLEWIDYRLGLVLLPVVVIAFAILAAYLGRLKVVTTSLNPPNSLSNWMQELTYKRRLLEIALDFFLISITYYLAFWARLGFLSNQAEIMPVYLLSLPLVLGITYAIFFIVGVYRGVWQYLGIADLLRFTWAIAISVSVLAIFLLTVYPSYAYSKTTFFLFGIFLFVGVTTSRASFKSLDLLYSRQILTKTQEKRVLIYGANDLGEMTLRWLTQNPQLGYAVIGFIEDDPFKWNRQIHGVTVLGGPDDLNKIFQTRSVDGIILASIDLTDPKLERFFTVCKSYQVWTESIRFELEPIE